MSKIKFLSSESFRKIAELGAELPGLPGADLVIQYVIGNVPERGEVSYALVVEEGRIADVREGLVESPSFRVAMDYDVSVKIHRMELKPPEAAASGQVVITGDEQLFRTMMEVVGRPEYQAMVKEFADLTEF